MPNELVRIPYGGPEPKITPELMAEIMKIICAPRQPVRWKFKDAK